MRWLHRLLLPPRGIFSTSTEYLSSYSKLHTVTGVQPWQAFNTNVTHSACVRVCGHHDIDISSSPIEVWRLGSGWVWWLLWAMAMRSSLSDLKTWQARDVCGCQGTAGQAARQWKIYTAKIVSYFAYHPPLVRGT